MADWVALLAAPFAGSFLYALVRRLPRDVPALWGRSQCEHCGHALSPAELLPIISFLAVRGRCRHCGGIIAIGHLAAELAAVAIVAAVMLSGASGLDLWAGSLLGWALLALAWIDATHFLLPDVLTLPLVVTGLGVAWWDAPWTLTDRALGAIAGFAAFRLIGALYKRLRGRDGLGQGDAKLLAAAGAWLGWQALTDVVLLAALLGLAVALAARLRGMRVTAATPLPFGPMLAAAAFAIWLAQMWQVWL